MWSVITRLFKNKPQDRSFSPKHQAYQPTKDEPVAKIVVDVSNTMDRNTTDERRKGHGVSSDQHSASGDSEHSSDSYDSRQVSNFYFFIEFHLTIF